MQFRGARGAEPRSRSQRMDARREQAFVDINISQSGQKRLIEQQGFDPRFAAQACAKFLQWNIERLGAEPRDALGVPRAPLDSAELARIVIENYAIIQREDAVCVLARGAAHQKLSGHAQVNGKRPLVEADDDEFSAPLHALYLAARQPSRERGAISRRDKSRIELHRNDTSAYKMRRDCARDPLHFGQFGHADNIVLRR